MSSAPWVAIRTDYWRNPKVVSAGFLAGALNIAGIGYCSEQLTDGFVPTMVVPILAAPMHGYVWVGEDACNPTFSDVVASRWSSLADDLVAAGLWEPVEGGFHIVNYLDHQPSRADVEAKREQAREAGRRGGMRRAANRSDKRTASESLGGQLSDSLSGGPRGSASGIQPPVPVPTPSSPTENQTLPSASPRQLGLVPDSDHDVEPSSFAIWYDAYPLHKGRADAEKAYAQALKKATAEQLLDGARRYALEVAGKDPAYIKHPGPWLRAGRWADEPSRPADRFGVGYGDADREGPSRVMSGAEWLTDPRSSA